MRRRAAAIFLGAVALAALAGIWALRRSREPAPPAAPPPAASAPAGETQPVELTLYFPGEDGRLYPERRELSAAPGSLGRARAVLDGLLAGPRDEALRAPLPSDVAIGHVVLLADGTAVVDLRSTERELPPAHGSLGERAMIYSLVDSLLLNVEGTRQVALLWNGVQRESFSGHLDTARPLAADTSLLAGR